MLMSGYDCVQMFCERSSLTSCASAKWWGSEIMGITRYTGYPLWVKGKSTAAFDIKNSMTSQKLRGCPKELCTIWILLENKRWDGKEVGTKNMWVTLARGVFIYGTHMTRNITANNTTNTQTLVTLPSQKKLPNKCHTNHLVVVKPLSKQARKFWLGLHFRGRKISITKKKRLVSILTPSTSLFHLFSAVCIKRRDAGSPASKVMYFFIF